MLLENVIPVVMINVFEQASEVFFVKDGHGLFGIDVSIKYTVENLNLGFCDNGFKIYDKGINLNLFLVVLFLISFFSKWI